MALVSVCSRRLALALILLASALLGATPSRAELPPQYTVWAEFGAVATQSSLPHLIGVVERIERVGAGRYVVRGGSCYVEISITRAAASGPGGQPVAGPSTISEVKVGDRKCN